MQVFSIRFINVGQYVYVIGTSIFVYIDYI